MAIQDGPRGGRRPRRAGGEQRRHWHRPRRAAGGAVRRARGQGRARRRFRRAARPRHAAARAAAGPRPPARREGGDRPGARRRRLRLLPRRHERPGPEHQRPRLDQLVLRPASACPGRRRKWAKILKLAHMRESLFANNLVRTYPDGVEDRVRRRPQPQVPEFAPALADGRRQLERPVHRRRRTGSTRWSARRTRGSSATSATTTAWPAVRPPDDACDRPGERARGQPQAARGEGPAASRCRSSTSGAAAWIQFMNHDWISHGTRPRRRGRPHPAGRRRPAARATASTTSRSAGRCADPTRRADGRPGAAGDVPQRGHALVGRLADLRQRLGDPARPALARRAAG